MAVSQLTHCTNADRALSPSDVALLRVQRTSARRRTMVTAATIQTHSCHPNPLVRRRRTLPGAEYVSQGSVNNSLCFLGPHRVFAPLSVGDKHELIPGQGHFGWAIRLLTRLLTRLITRGPHCFTTLTPFPCAQSGCCSRRFALAPGRGDFSQGGSRGHLDHEHDEVRLRLDVSRRRASLLAHIPQCSSVQTQKRKEIKALGGEHVPCLA